MTEKRYESDCYETSFQAKVLQCYEEKKEWKVILDQTCFYPEGGGQPADHGKLNTVHVLDVHEIDGYIVHTVDGPLQVGIQVEGEIDWNRRFSNMQNHTGEHILSGIVHRKFGFDNVGFHMGEEYIRIDFNGVLTEENIKEIEDEANRGIYRNIPVKASFPSREALDRMEYRSKKELTGKVRILEVPGYDCCACCGTHVARTGEIGLIKILSSQKYKGGTRMFVLCGKRALEDYQRKNASVYEISNLLSAKVTDIASAVTECKKQEGEYKRRLTDLQKQFLTLKVESIPKGTERVCRIESGLYADMPRIYCNMICERAKLGVVFHREETGGYRYVIIGDQDVRPLGKALNQKFQGRGGGSAQMAQGSIEDTSEDELKAFVENFRF